VIGFGGSQRFSAANSRSILKGLVRKSSMPVARHFSRSPVHGMVSQRDDGNAAVFLSLTGLLFPFLASLSLMIWVAR
jgi:hypothetical protein